MPARAALLQPSEDASPSGVIAQAVSIDEREFRLLSELIQRQTGIALAPSKKALLCSRLAKRLRHYAFSTFSEYYELVTERDVTGEELSRLVNCVTTNFTSFFREAHHFDFLREEVVPELRARSAASRRVRIWSAGCSTGEEPYSIAMALAESLGSLAGWDIKILATDVDSDVLEQAECGVFGPDALSGISLGLRQRYFRNLRDGSHCAEVSPQLSQLIRFRRLNLVDDSWPMRATFDAIFCRNVAIYFARPTQDQVFARLAQRLTPGGYLFTGHSENLYAVRQQLCGVGRTIYRRPNDAGVALQSPVPESAGSEKSPEDALPVGGVVASREPRILSTVLGSCVGVCLYDPVARVGGMNHFLLPGSGPDGQARYGAQAMRALLDEVVRLGAVVTRLRAKVFGAAQLLDVTGPASTVPELNARFAMEFLHGERIAVESVRVGGVQPIQVKFATQTGRALVRVLDASRAREGLSPPMTSQPIEMGNAELR